MSYSFEYIDIILLAMIAGFIFLRLRGILGKKTGFEGKIPPKFDREFQKTNIASKPVSENFDEVSQKEFLKGAGANLCVYTHTDEVNGEMIQCLFDIAIFDDSDYLILKKH